MCIGCEFILFGCFYFGSLQTCSFSLGQFDRFQCRSFFFRFQAGRLFIGFTFQLGGGGSEFGVALKLGLLLRCECERGLCLGFSFRFLCDLCFGGFAFNFRFCLCGFDAFFLGLCSTQSFSFDRSNFSRFFKCSDFFSF